MKEKTAFFAVARKYLESALWLQEPFTKGQAWIDLVGRASFEDGDLTKRGELLISERNLAKRWQWSRKKVQCFLKYLENEDMIQRTINRSSKSTTYGTTIHIENYEVYQNARTTKGTKQGTREGAIYNNRDNIDNISLYMPDGMTAELESLYGDRASALIEDVRRYYEGHPDKEFPGWPIAVAQFNANQARWERPKKKRRRSVEEILAEEEQYDSEGN